MVTRLIVVLSLSFTMGCAGGASVKAKRMQAGDEAPAFVLNDLFGTEEVSSGKIVHNNHATVITIWSIACPNCREALLDVQKVRDQYRGHAVAFLGINFDTQNLQGVRSFLKGEGIDFPTLWDKRQRVAVAYKARDYTFSIFVVDRSGTVVLAQYDHPPDLGAILAKTLDRILE